MMRVPIHKLQEGLIVTAIDRMIQRMWEEQITTMSACVEIELETPGLEKTPVVTLFFHRPDPYFEVSDYYGWREAIFGRQFYDLFRYLDAQGQVASGLTMRLTPTGHREPIEFKTDLTTHVPA